MIKAKKTPHKIVEPRAEAVGEVLTLIEAAAYFRVGQDDVLRLITEQDLPARRLGNECGIMAG
jgi:hypothetical protein